MKAAWKKLVKTQNSKFLPTLRNFAQLHNRHLAKPNKFEKKWSPPRGERLLCWPAPKCRAFVGRAFPRQSTSMGCECCAPGLGLRLRPCLCWARPPPCPWSRTSSHLWGTYRQSAVRSTRELNADWTLSAAGCPIAAPTLIRYANMRLNNKTIRTLFVWYVFAAKLSIFFVRRRCLNSKYFVYGRNIQWRNLFLSDTRVNYGFSVVHLFNLLPARFYNEISSISTR